MGGIEQLKGTVLFRELEKCSTHSRGLIPAGEVESLRGIVGDVAITVEPLLSRISHTFQQYTNHDIQHSLNIIELMGLFIPEETLGQLNALELSLLILAALLHDSGMVVAPREKATALTSQDFLDFRHQSHPDRAKAIDEARREGKDLRAQAIEDAILADYYRRLHPERVQQFISEHFKERFRYGDVDFSRYLVQLCESHAWGVRESNDATAPHKAVARMDDNVRLMRSGVNLQYLACCLRLGDILDFDRTRTPLSVFQHIEFTESKSWDEWNKHLQVQGMEITSIRVLFEVSCTHPVFYVAVQEVLDYIDRELSECRYLLEEKPRSIADRYIWKLPHLLDRHKVRMEDPTFVAGAFRFQLEYEQILRLLMDKSLYPDPSLFLRELLQNALDACRRKEAEGYLKFQEKKIYKPEIVIWDMSNDKDVPRIVFQDNGVGMSLRVVEQYFLRVGRSFYRSPEFSEEQARLSHHGIELDACSQFGIGILSCFLVGNTFEVHTMQEGKERLHIKVDGPTKYFIIRRLSSDNNRFINKDVDVAAPEFLLPHGTRLIVYLDSTQEINVLESLKEVAVNVDYPIRVYVGNKKKAKYIGKNRWEKPIQVFDFPESVAPPFDDGIHDLTNLDGVIGASIIPFKAWEFTRHFRGQGWFWLLRDADGGLCPQRGYLRFASNLEVIGLPFFLSQLEPIVEAARPYILKRLVDILSRSIGRQGGAGLGVFLKFLNRRNMGREYVEFIQAFQGRNRHASEDAERLAHEAASLDEGWMCLSTKEQSAVCEWLTAIANFGERQKWGNAPGLVRGLLEGSLDWVKSGAIFGETGYDSFSVIQYFNDSEPEELALHGIRIPQGIMRSDMSRIDGRGLNVVRIPGGARLDIRGVRAPTPAASRLFVPNNQRHKIVTPYLRATVLHAASLVAKKVGKLEWREWLNHIWNQVEWEMKETDCREDREWIEENCKLHIRVLGEARFLTRYEVRSLFGKSAPCVHARDRSEKDGIIASDSINRMVLAPRGYLRDRIDIS